MKNTILIFVGIVMLLYTLAIGSEIFAGQAGQNELDNCLSRVVEDTLEDFYGQNANEEAIQRLRTDLWETLGEDIQIMVEAIDMEKGILSVEICKEYRQFSGKTKELRAEKTAIVEQDIVPRDQVLVQFLVGEELYKEYSLMQGEDCPVPKLPSELYIGWQEYGTQDLGLITEIRQVEEDKVYVAVTE